MVRSNCYFFTIVLMEKFWHFKPNISGWRERNTQSHSENVFWLRVAFSVCETAFYFLQTNEWCTCSYCLSSKSTSPWWWRWCFAYFIYLQTVADSVHLRGSIFSFGFSFFTFCLSFPSFFWIYFFVLQIFRLSFE